MSIYAAIIQRAKEAGTLTGSYDSRVFAQIVVAIFFQELDKGMYRYDYPYELLFKQKLDILFEGHRGDHGEIAVLPRRQKGGFQFVKIGHGFEEDQISALFSRLDGVRENIVRLVEGHGTRRLHEFSHGA